MAKLLVTGGAGFIGSNFVRYWLTNHPEDSITNLDALTYAGNLASLRDVEQNSNYEFVQGNILDEALVDELVGKCDRIVHFAAESHVDRSILGPAAFVETNIKGTFVLLESARKHKKPFHHISTDEVFGSLELGSSEKFSEDTRYEPNSPYSASKASSDHLVRAYHETYGLPITITNCSNNFGPYQHPEKFIPRMVTDVIDGGNVKIYGDGLYVRDWLYVEDHCRAIDAVLTGGKVGETYLVGGMTSDVSNKDIALMVLSLMGLAEDKIEYVQDRPGHDRRYAVDWTKINRELGWEPKHTVEEWLQETVLWYRNNESWWRPLKEKAESIYTK
ncbi:MAG: dTDP-glucose 4,6-dehydratase [Candidatus Andersenbacteria bacterium RIFCSPHIGHO2_12_FULL_45_11]|uniref:dTDP-glucose 4,6-dehydratase n=1 Tax=Candidatus Andersenbacteria bacterium RIFCSPHIGHO2_12_FULL_45_11 TaxID=1797281 RepID=A0A1G1X4L6_9BACT|nr:MAG: dTDP-glucose 4,6-dehydratase [Candidatus Andersenbacteria bacterium RIFCSPHIGHO2_12_FULL_45_11]